MMIVKSVSTNELPQGYEEALTFDLKKDKKLVVWLNVLSVFALIPFLPLWFWMTWKMNVQVDPSLNLLILLIGIVVMLILHEAVHGIFFKLGTDQKVKFGFNGLFAYAGAPGIYYKKKYYLMIGLAPLALVSLLLIVLMLLFREVALLPLYLIFVVHFSGCVGDMYVCAKIRKLPDEALLVDTGLSMTAYTRSKETPTIDE